MMLRLIACATTLLLLSTSIAAKMYKCVDAKGSVSYSQTQCPESAKTKLIRKQNTSSKTSLVPVTGLDGERYYVNPDQLDMQEPRPSDYYSPANQVRRMQQDREMLLEKQEARERRAADLRRYKKSTAESNRRNREYREGRCRYYESMSGSKHDDAYYQAKKQEFCN